VPPRALSTLESGSPPSSYLDPRLPPRTSPPLAIPHLQQPPLTLDQQVEAEQQREGDAEEGMAKVAQVPSSDQMPWSPRRWARPVLPKALTESDAMAPMESSHSLSRIRRVVFFHALFSTSVQLLLPEKTNQVLKV
jgi:hypothetical protein